MCVYVCVRERGRKRERGEEVGREGERMFGCYGHFPDDLCNEFEKGLQKVLSIMPTNPAIPT